MGVFHILALLAAALPLRAFAPRGSAGERPGSRRWAVAAAAGVALIVAFAGYAYGFQHAIDEVRPGSLVAGLPFHFLELRAHETARAGSADVLLVPALVEAVALALFLRHFVAFDRRLRRIAVAAIALGLAASALATNAVDSGDPYLYVGLATLGVHAYAPPPVPFGGDLHAINGIWGTPLFPSSYGPVWIALSALLVAPLGTLGAKIFAFKLVGLASVAACAYLARKLGAAPIVVAGIACNPALYAMYVASAHNDLFCVDIVLAAMLAARRNAVAAFALALVAGFAKVSLAPIAAVATVAFVPLRVRVVFMAGLALVLGSAYAAGHGLMWHALVWGSSRFVTPSSPLDLAFRAVLVLMTLGAGAWAVLRRRVWAQVAWSPPGFGDFPLPSYSAWGLPFALGSTPVCLAYLVTLPFLAFLQCPTLPVTHTLDVAGDAFVLAAIFVAAYRLRPQAPAAVADGYAAGR